MSELKTKLNKEKTSKFKLEKWVKSIVGGIIFILIILFIIFPSQMFIVSSVIFENPARDKELIQKAVATSNYKLCNKVGKEYAFSLSQPREGCYRQVVKKVATKEICEVSDVKKNLGAECYRIVAPVFKDETICAVIDKKLQASASCYLDVAIAKSDLKICESINGPFPVRDKANCYAEFMKKNNDLSICEKANDPIVKEECYSRYLGTGASVTAQFCKDHFKIRESRINACYTIVARETGDLQLCQNMRGEYREWNKTNCEEQVREWRKE